MASRRFCLVTVLFCVPLVQAQEHVQVQIQEHVHVSDAAATVVGRKSYRAGDTVIILVRLNPTPNGYGGGSVRCIFENTTDKGKHSPSMQSSTAETEPLTDGFSDYTFRINVTENMTA